MSPVTKNTKKDGLRKAREESGGWVFLLIGAGWQRLWVLRRGVVIARFPINSSQRGQAGQLCGRSTKINIKKQNAQL